MTDGECRRVLVPLSGFGRGDSISISHNHKQHVKLNKTTILPDLEGKSSILVSYRAITNRAVELEAMLTP